MAINRVVADGVYVVGGKIIRIEKARFDVSSG